METRFKGGQLFTEAYIEDQLTSSRRELGYSAGQVVQFMCEGHVLYIHKSLLVAQSQLLGKLLKDDLSHCPCVILPDFDIETVEKFCRLLYQGYTLVGALEIEKVRKVADVLGFQKPTISDPSVEDVQLSRKLRYFQKSEYSVSDSPSNASSIASDEVRKLPTDKEGLIFRDQQRCKRRRFYGLGRKKSHDAKKRKTSTDYRKEEKESPGKVGGKERTPKPTPATPPPTWNLRRHSDGGGTADDHLNMFLRCYFCSCSFASACDLSCHISYQCGKHLAGHLAFDSKFCDFCETTSNSLTAWGYVRHLDSCYKRFHSAKKATDCDMNNSDPCKKSGCMIGGHDRKSKEKFPRLVLTPFSVTDIRKNRSSVTEKDKENNADGDSDDSGSGTGFETYKIDKKVSVPALMPLEEALRIVLDSRRVNKANSQEQGCSRSVISKETDQTKMEQSESTETKESSHKHSTDNVCFVTTMRSESEKECMVMDTRDELRPGLACQTGQRSLPYDMDGQHEISASSIDTISPSAFTEEVFVLNEVNMDESPMFEPIKIEVSEDSEGLPLIISNVFSISPSTSTLYTTQQETSTAISEPRCSTTIVPDAGNASHRISDTVAATNQHHGQKSNQNSIINLIEELIKRSLPEQEQYVKVLEQQLCVPLVLEAVRRICEQGQRSEFRNVYNVVHVLTEIWNRNLAKRVQEVAINLSTRGEILDSRALVPSSRWCFPFSDVRVRDVQNYLNIAVQNGHLLEVINQGDKCYLLSSNHEQVRNQRHQQILDAGHALPVPNSPQTQLARVYQPQEQIPGDRCHPTSGPHSAQSSERCSIDVPSTSAIGPDLGSHYSNLTIRSILDRPTQPSFGSCAESSNSSSVNTAQGDRRNQLNVCVECGMTYEDPALLMNHICGI